MNSTDLQLTFARLSDAASAEEAASLDSQLGIGARWELTDRVLKQVQLRWVHFLHVPKTAGTSLAENLARSGLIPVISVDMPQYEFLKKLYHLLRGEPGRVVMSRSHHTYPYLREQLQRNPGAFVFSFFRPPEDIHASNAAMIARRVMDFALGVAQPSNIADFSRNWAELIDFEKHTPEKDGDLVSAVLRSKAYRNQYSDIYRRYFDDCKFSELDAIAFYPHHAVNEFMSCFFPSIEPVRLNVREREAAGPQDLPEGLISDSERRLVQSIESRLVCPQDTYNAFGDVFSSKISKIERD